MLASGHAAEHDLVPIAEDIAAANYEATQVIAHIRQVMRKEYDIQPLDLNAIVLDVVQVLNSSAANEGVLLVADLDPDLPLITADRVQLRQVAMNLVLNAVQATRSHPADPAVVRIATAASANSHVAMIVDDAGPGVAAEALPRLFEPYFTTKADGLGMGLSISRSIVESHGGSIGVANVPHGGARFTVTLPAD